MSVIPSTRGPGGGLRRLIYVADSTANQAQTLPNAASYTDATDVRGYDEVVLNIECLENFYVGTHPYVPGGAGTATYGNIISVSMMYTTTNSYVPPAVTSEYWAPLLAEEVETPFTGVVETADYVIKLESLQTDVLTKPNDGTLGRILRFPVTMATWVFFKVIVDSLGNEATLGHATSTLPVFNVKLYRGLAL